MSSNTNSKTPQLSVRVEKEYYDMFQMLADESKLTKSKFMAEIIQFYFDNYHSDSYSANKTVTNEITNTVLETSSFVNLEMFNLKMDELERYPVTKLK